MTCRPSQTFIAFENTGVQKGLAKFGPLFESGLQIPFRRQGGFLVRLSPRKFAQTSIPVPSLLASSLLAHFLFKLSFMSDHSSSPYRLVKRLAQHQPLFFHQQRSHFSTATASTMPQSCRRCLVLGPSQTCTHPLTFLPSSSQAPPSLRRPFFSSSS